ncbi:MAG: hypothetical protein ACTHOK_08590 [Nocardioidaceae bacterium]
MSKRLTGALAGAALISVGLAAPAAAAVINGTSGPDVLIGTTKADAIRGYAGADRIYAKAGGDTVYTGKDRKRDQVWAGPGADRIHGRSGDYIHAGAGNDVIRLTNVKVMATTIVWCGPGRDRVYGLSDLGFYSHTYGCEVKD